MTRPTDDEIRSAREKRAADFKLHGLPGGKADLTLSEALVLGLLKQGVSVFYTVFGHGSTEVGEVLRIYHEAGLARVYGLRNEIEASHAASALRWITGEKAAVVTSIGPGALQALAASIMPASDGLGVYYLFGDETSEDEGYNMQQIPRREQGGFLKMMSAMGRAYSLHTPLALSSALQAGAVTVDHPYKPSPFYLLMPMNTQAAWLEGFNLDELPEAVAVQSAAAAGDYQSAVEAIMSAKRVIIKAGGGAVGAGDELVTLLELTRGVLVHTPIATGCIPYSHPANMGVGGSKGSLCGNFAMEQADLLIAVGTRAVCQSDCSRTGYPLVKQVININSDPEDALHYNHTLALTGDAASTLRLLNQALAQQPVRSDDTWRTQCTEQKNQWLVLKEVRRQVPTLHDDYWQREVLTQPAAILTALDWAKANAVVSIF
ncbi:MAG: thiamine pyrophosphate-binding protein, partial [Chloroflexi bacterium HGW-Chloroflexi-5]